MQIRSAKIGCILIIFQWFTLKLSSNIKIKKKLTKLINYKERSKYQKTIIYKNIQSKSCRAAEELSHIFRVKSVGVVHSPVISHFRASLAFLQVGSLSWVLASYDVR